MFQRPAAHRPEGRSFCYFWLVLKPPYFYIWCRCSILYYLILFNIISIYIYSYTVYIYICIYIYIYIYISCSYLNDVLFSILKPPWFFPPKHSKTQTSPSTEDHELHDLTVAVTRTKHRLSGAISLLMEALQELKDKGAASVFFWTKGGAGWRWIGRRIQCVYIIIYIYIYYTVYINRYIYRL